jgi:guanosine-3',5'-bis(diphosphate) 3'-pyrophosphohydrolase
MVEMIQRKVLAHHPQADVSVIAEAGTFAEKAHEGQFRKSGEPYITHPLAVAEIVADLQLDVASVAAAILHDVVEDCGVSVETLEATFGKEIASLVEGVTKLEKLQFNSRDEAQVENLRSSTSRARAKSGSPRRRWTSMLPWRTAWVSARSSGSWRTSPSVT